MKYIKGLLATFSVAGVAWLAWDGGYKEGVRNAVKALRLNEHSEARTIDLQFGYERSDA